MWGTHQRKNKKTSLPGPLKKTKNCAADQKSLPDVRKRLSQGRSRTRGAEITTTVFLRASQAIYDNSASGVSATNTQQGSRLFFFFGIDDNPAG